RPVIIPNGLGQRLTPSVVRFLDSGEVLVGDHAARSHLLDPRNTITGVKRLIGRRYNEVVDIATALPYDVVLGEGDLALIRAIGRLYSPQMIAAMILRSLRE